MNSKVKLMKTVSCADLEFLVFRGFTCKKDKSEKNQKLHCLADFKYT